MRLPCIVEILTAGQHGIQQNAVLCKSYMVKLNKFLPNTYELEYNHLQTYYNLLIFRKCFNSYDNFKNSIKLPLNLFKKTF